MSQENGVYTPFFLPFVAMLKLKVWLAESWRAPVAHSGATHFEYWLSLPKKELMYLCVTKLGVQFQKLGVGWFRYSGVPISKPKTGKSYERQA